MPTNSASTSDSCSTITNRWPFALALLVCGMVLVGITWPSFSGALAWQVDPIGTVEIETIAHLSHAKQAPTSLYAAFLMLMSLPFRSVGDWVAWAGVIKGLSIVATLSTIGLVMHRTRGFLIAPALLSTPGILLAASSVSPVMISVLGISIARRTPGKTLRFLIWITALLLTATAPNTLALAQWSEVICLPIGVAGAILAVIRLGRKSAFQDAVPTLVYATLIGFGGFPTLNRPDMMLVGIGGLLLTLIDRPFPLDRKWVAAFGVGIGIQVLLSLPYYVGIATGQLRTLPYQSSIRFQEWYPQIPDRTPITVTSGIKINYTQLDHPGHIDRAKTGPDLLEALADPTIHYVLIDESDPLFLSKSPETQGVANQIITFIQSSPSRWHPIASGPGWRLLKQGDE